MMYLFMEVKYELGSKTLESISYPGQIASMLGYPSYPGDVSTNAGFSEKSFWSKDTTDNANSSKYARSAEAPAGGYTPGENPNYNQGFAARRDFYLVQIPEVVLNFTYHLPIFLDLQSIKRLFMD